jgi:hypothetical protein
MLNWNWKSNESETGARNNLSAIQAGWVRLTLCLIVSLVLLTMLAAVPHPW